ncbi:hypothetical protein BN890_38320 [Bacteroides xylanisolvens SD CC 1b]|uniref:Uncharacterized protein n=1 Tax=Bacteroides xylanisolvens SD CC 1b TaxID=702447 RepID=W6P972_9BACE|nr:hypothetical protein BN890_38320 [Bacteroides xylanisolvens SD CC 1b]
MKYRNHLTKKYYKYIDIQIEHKKVGISLSRLRLKYKL